MIDQTSLKSIEDLHRLKNEGIITEAEFEQSKQKILFGPKPKPGLTIGTGNSEPLPTPAMDDLLGWVTLPLKRYADFNGRSSRREYWLFQLALIVLGIVVVTMIGGDLSAGGGVFSGLMLLMSGIAVLGLIVPLIALQVRRFHDQDRSGWFALINLVPYLGSFIVLVFMCIEGTKGDNQFGPDPTVP